MIRALVLSGDGINCETETAFACKQTGFDVDVVSVARLIDNKFSQTQLEFSYRLLVLPGGFSFGDDLGSGRILALKIRKGLGWNLKAFSEQGGMVLGICNGFQALIRLGVFGKEVSITKNSSNQFIDRWVNLKVNMANRSPWLSAYSEFELPIRHGEGRLLFSTQAKENFDTAIQYACDINGSQENIAGITTKDGRILGLMPHPEAFVKRTQHPTWTKYPETCADVGDGLQLFKNAYEELRNNVT